MIKIKIKNKQFGGFTLIELILYLGIVTFFISSLVLFAWNIVYGREKSTYQQVVEQNGRIAMSRIAYEIRRAVNIISVNSNQIILDNNGSTTTISLNSGKVQLTDSSGGPYNLTSNQVEVITLTFTNLSSLEVNSKDIKIDMNLRQLQNIASGKVPAQISINQSVEFKGQFNQARSLLIDASALALTNGNKRMEGISLSNSNSANIIIDKVTLSWTGGSLGSQVQSLLINGTTVWSGSGNSGDLLEINNTTLLPADVFPFIANFSNSMDGSTLTISFKMTDGSTALAILTFGIAPTGTPVPTSTIVPTLIPTNTPTLTPTLVPTNTPTLTPTPTPANCFQYCMQKYGTSGGCEKPSSCRSPKHNEGKIYGCGGKKICCCN